MKAQDDWALDESAASASVFLPVLKKAFAQVEDASQANWDELAKLLLASKFFLDFHQWPASEVQ